MTDRLIHSFCHCLLGIGVDDMFVIVQCYDQLRPSELKLPMSERIGLTMQHAGMSILVTSITDICAFAVGSTTVSDSCTCTVFARAYAPPPLFSKRLLSRYLSNILLPLFPRCRLNIFKHTFTRSHPLLQYTASCHFSR